METAQSSPSARLRSNRGTYALAFACAAKMSLGGKPPSSQRSRQYVNFVGFPFPLGPILSRATIRRELIPELMWSFEQEQGLEGSPVSTNVRMTAVKTRNGGLWIHAPIAPTEECIELVKDLGFPVESIVNPTYAYEHRVFVPAFCRKFPDASLYSVRGWSWPIPLPDALLGLNVSAYLDEEDKIPWRDEFDVKVCPPASLGIAPYTEAAFLHERTKTLITTDLFIYVPLEPPEVIPRQKLTSLGQPNARLAQFRRGDAQSPPDADTMPARVLGWMRMTTLAVFLGPNSLLDPVEAFDSVRGRLTVSPVLRVLVYPKISSAVRAWTNQILTWEFDRIVPAHFDAPIRAGAEDARGALACVLEGAEDPVRETDLQTLRGIDGFLRWARIVRDSEQE